MKVITIIITQQTEGLPLTIVFQMGFVDIIWNFGFHYVQLVTRRQLGYNLRNINMTPYFPVM